MKNIGVFAYLIDENDKLLLIKRNYGDKTWAGPGGAIESNEHAIEALQRELKEEIGISISSFTFENICYANQEYSIAICFSSRIHTSHIELLRIGDINELSGMHFFSKEDLPQNINTATLKKVEMFLDKKKQYFFEV